MDNHRAAVTPAQSAGTPAEDGNAQYCQCHVLHGADRPPVAAVWPWSASGFVRHHARTLLGRFPLQTEVPASILAFVLGLALAASAQAAPLGPTSVPAANVVTVQGWPNWQWGSQGGPGWDRERERREGIVNLAARGMLVVSVARRLGSEGPLLAYCAAPL